ncbi:hypothetical protein C8034_v006471 [Colletotrichum sidae]|uniref:Uncharacterized protein n=1 Tax=Colletotrichum sidae TaxID=1347389 RepID=A0A4R8TV91_9PEZI|nr:hypothetical protein C8034_v006471 [Colletotrichum sidae]
MSLSLIEGSRCLYSQELAGYSCTLSLSTAGRACFRALECPYELPQSVSLGNEAPVRARQTVGSMRLGWGFADMRSGPRSCLDPLRQEERHGAMTPKRHRHHGLIPRLPHPAAALPSCAVAFETTRRSQARSSRAIAAKSTANSFSRGEETPAKRGTRGTPVQLAYIVPSGITSLGGLSRMTGIWVLCQSTRSHMYWWATGNPSSADAISYFSDEYLASLSNLHVDRL